MKVKYAGHNRTFYISKTNLLRSSIVEILSLKSGIQLKYNSQTVDCPLSYHCRLGRSSWGYATPATYNHHHHFSSARSSWSFSSLSSSWSVSSSPRSLEWVSCEEHIVRDRTLLQLLISSSAGGRSYLQLKLLQFSSPFPLVFNIMLLQTQPSNSPEAE